LGNRYPKVGAVALSGVLEPGRAGEIRRCSPARTPLNQDNKRQARVIFLACY